MSDGRTASRILAILAAVLVVVAVGGLLVAVILNAFVLNNFKAYGEVRIPGESTVYLPAGEVSVNFHTQVIGSTSGTGLPLPPLRLSVTPPAGVADPIVIESFGATTTVNSDAHRRVWLIRVPAEGGYRIAVDGQVNGFIDPRLAFGDDASVDWPLWLFAGMALAGVELAVLAWWLRRRRGHAAVADLGDPYIPSDEGVQLEQLKTIAALRDSGALTDAEFDAEKRRILSRR